MEKLLRHSIIGDEDIGPPITVVISETDTQTFAGMICNSGLFRNIAKAAVPLVMKEEVSDGAELIRMAVGAVAGFVLSAKGIYGEIPL
jgi:hypothetical protein